MTTIESSRLRAFVNAVRCSCVSARAMRRNAGWIVAGLISFTHAPSHALAQDDIEDGIEDSVDDAVEDTVEDSVDDAVEDTVEDSVDDAVEDTVEDSVDDAVEDTVDDSVDDAVEDTVDDSVDDAVEDTVDDSVDDAVEDKVDDDTEDRIDEKSARDSEDRIADHAHDEPDHSEHDDHDQSDDADHSDDADDHDADHAADRHDDDIDLTERQWRATERAAHDRDIEAVGDSIELRGIERDERGLEIARGEWLVSATDEAFRQLAKNGFHFRSVERLGLLGERLARVEIPRNIAAEESFRRIKAIAPSARIDRNDLYTAQAVAPYAAPHSGIVGIRPRDAIALPRAANTVSKRIGLIDTQLAANSPALRNAQIVRQDFVGSTNRRPSDHGTAIASILVGQTGQYMGLLPKSRLFAASVFEDLPGRPRTATTVSLLRALNWMVAQGIGVVNMSLSGPPNAILQQAIARARAQGVLVVAAVGNDGPNARPRYPAAYDGVISVTATTRDHRVFRLANRGAFLDFAAPGVGIAHALPQGGFGVSSGTSMAAPFVSAILLMSSDGNGRIGSGVEDRLKRNALDLGRPGFDEIYGYGLIRSLP